MLQFFFMVDSVSISPCRCFVTYDLACISLYFFSFSGTLDWSPSNRQLSKLDYIIHRVFPPATNQSKDMDTLLEQADTLVARYSPLIDITKSSLAICLLSIAFNPTAWNIVARNGMSPFPPAKEKNERG